MGYCRLRSSHEEAHLALLNYSDLYLALLATIEYQIKGVEGNEVYCKTLRLMKKVDEIRDNDSVREMIKSDFGYEIRDEHLDKLGRIISGLENKTLSKSNLRKEKKFLYEERERAFDHVPGCGEARKFVSDLARV